MSADVTDFPGVRARRVPLPRTQRDNLADISRPEQLRSDYVTMILTAAKGVANTFGGDTEEAARLIAHELDAAGFRMEVRP